MRTKSAIVCTLVIGLIFTVAVPANSHDTPRIDGRIVQPYNLPADNHIPILAGYEPVPTPVHCAPGHPLTSVVYHEDFEGSHGWSFTGTSLGGGGPNLWQVTAFSGHGLDFGHSSPNRLYFGSTSTGNYDFGHVSGTAQSPVIALPDTPGLVLVFNSKWAVEWLKGYDHMWVEMEGLDILTGSTKIHLLCSNNALDRGDASSTGDFHGVGSCSPLLVSPCPTKVPGTPTQNPVLPAWETRMINIPPHMAGTDVRIRFTFDSADDVANQFLGWMVDDVQIGYL